MGRLFSAAILTAALAGIGAALAQTYPLRPIKIVVPVQPGGGSDVLARLLADQIGQAHGPAMVIENRPGAGSLVGTEAVSRAPPDGSSLLIATESLLIIPHLRKVNYDPLKSFEPICQLVSSPTVIAVNGASPYRTLADLLNAARARPGDLTLAGSGMATFFHIAFERLKRVVNVNMTYVPFAGGAPAVTAVLGNHVTSVFTDYPTAVEQVRAGTLRALATASRTRIESLPDLPTVAESSFSDYALDHWFALFAPVKTPAATISQFAGWFTEALAAPETRRKLLAQGMFPVGTCSAEFGALLRKQYDDYGRIIREANIKAE
jgi:tripartite-type tricarboxylate transporter receptor subunit TctC